MVQNGEKEHISFEAVLSLEFGITGNYRIKREFGSSKWQEHNLFNVLLL